MSVKFKMSEKRMESNQAEAKSNPRKNWYAVGTDSKGKSYITTIDNAMSVVARREASEWAKANSLTLEVVNVAK